MRDKTLGVGIELCRKIAASVILLASRRPQNYYVKSAHVLQYISARGLDDRADSQAATVWTSEIATTYAFSEGLMYHDGSYVTRG